MKTSSIDNLLIKDIRNSDDMEKNIVNWNVNKDSNKRKRDSECSRYNTPDANNGNHQNLKFHHIEGKRMKIVYGNLDIQNDCFSEYLSTVEFSDEYSSIDYHIKRPYLVLRMQSFCNFDHGFGKADFFPDYKKYIDFITRIKADKALKNLFDSKEYINYEIKNPDMSDFGMDKLQNYMNNNECLDKKMEILKKTSLRYYLYNNRLVEFCILSAWLIYMKVNNLVDEVIEFCYFSNCFIPVQIVYLQQKIMGIPKASACNIMKRFIQRHTESDIEQKPIFLEQYLFFYFDFELIMNDKVIQLFKNMDNDRIRSCSHPLKIKDDSFNSSNDFLYKLSNICMEQDKFIVFHRMIVASGIDEYIIGNKTKMFLDKKKIAAKYRFNINTIDFLTNIFVNTGLISVSKFIENICQVEYEEHGHGFVEYIVRECLSKTNKQCVKKNILFSFLGMTKNSMSIHDLRNERLIRDAQCLHQYFSKIKDEATFIECFFSYSRDSRQFLIKKLGIHQFLKEKKVLEASIYYVLDDIASYCDWNIDVGASFIFEASKRENVNAYNLLDKYYVRYPDYKDIYSIMRLVYGISDSLDFNIRSDELNNYIHFLIRIRNKKALEKLIDEVKDPKDIKRLLDSMQESYTTPVSQERLLKDIFKIFGIKIDYSGKFPDVNSRVESARDICDMLVKKGICTHKIKQKCVFGLALQLCATGVTHPKSCDDIHCILREENFLKSYKFLAKIFCSEGYPGHKVMQSHGFFEKQYCDSKKYIKKVYGLDIDVNM